MNRFGNCKGLNHVIGYSRGLYHTVNERCLVFSYARHKGKHGKLYIVEEINKFRFREKKYELPVFFFLYSANENCKNYRQNDHASFNQINKLTRYQNSADFCEIWPEHSLDVVKPKRVAHGELQCNAHRVFSAARTLQIN